MIVTIGRECGCGAHKVAELLAQTLGIPVMDQKKLAEKVKEAGIYLELESFLEEKPVNSLLYSIALNEGAGSRNMSKPLEHIRELLQEDCVYMGHCGNVIFRDREDCVTVFLTGEKDAKIKCIENRKNLNAKKAEAYGKKTDEGRAEFHEYYTGETWGYAGNYDLSLNSTKLGPEKTCEMVLEYMKRKNK